MTDTVELFAKFSNVQLTKAYCELSKKVSLEKAELKKKMKPLEQKIQLLQGEILRRMKEEEVEMYDSPAGKLSKQKKIYYKIIEPEKLYDYLVKEKDFSCVSITPIAAQMKTHAALYKELPPGITTSEAYNLYRSSK